MYFLGQVQRDRVGIVGVLEGSTDDAAGARRVLDRVRDPPPWSAAAKVPCHPTVLGGVLASGHDPPPIAGPTGAAAPSATPS